MGKQILRPVLVLFVLPVALMYCYHHFVVYAQEKFDQRNWLSARGQLRRGRMVEDLRKHHLPRGMSHAAVLQLLGPPDQEGETLHPAPGVTNYGYLSYSVGFGELVITFDRDGNLCSLTTASSP